MALQSILHDPNISTFLDQIPQNQHIITLKQLIYIGIKIVSNSFNSNQNPQNSIYDVHNKQNKKSQYNKDKLNKKSIGQNLSKVAQNQKKFKKSKKSHIQTISNRSDKIQSTLLRQISKIRLQLQSLTNKVYDHYFDQNQPSQSQQSIQFNQQKQTNYFNQHGFNHPQDIPTFSPSKQKQNITSSYQNPFLKQKNHFFTTQNNQRVQKQTNRNRNFSLKQQVKQPNLQHRCKSRSHIMHLDDTQIRQALYKQDNQESQAQQIPKNRQKKSHSLIQKRHQQKKKDQQNFFYQLNVQKQSLKELQKFKQSKNQPQDSYRDFVDNKPPRVDHFKKKAKSKIKPLVQRDRLKYQSKMQQQNFQKGFEQYQYSANELDQNQQEQQEFSEDNEQENQDTYNQQSNFNSQAEKQQRSAQDYNNSVEYQYAQQRNSSNPNFGFYDSKNQSESVSRRQDTFNNNQSIPDNRQIIQANQSSFSQFSQFSMSSSNSKRQIGKISRRRQE